MTSLQGKKFQSLYVIVSIIILALGAFVQISRWKVDAQKFDIFYLFTDGQRIRNGENPYARVLESDMLNNNKYTTMFPVFIELSFLTQFRQFTIFENWLQLWRVIFLLANLSIAGLLLWIFSIQNRSFLGMVAASFWLFNRWTLYLESVSGMDFLPILFLVLSLLLLSRNRWGGLLLFSLSLAIKQIGIFLLPVYLIYIYQNSEKNKLRESIKAALVIASIPMVTALPFLIWNLKGFLLSILFSLTRSQYQFTQDLPSLDMTFGVGGVKARAPMLFLMLLTYFAAYRYKLGILFTSSIILALFVGFNSIFFYQYMPWFIITVLLTWWQLAARHEANEPLAGG